MWPHRLIRTSQAIILATFAVVAVAVPARAVPAGPPSACGPRCQLAWQQQRADALPRTSFYQAPYPLPFAPPGTLIRQQTTSVYRVGNQAVTATRILYHSRTSGGRDIAVSGVVLLPAGAPPPGGWPVVLDAHGSSGIAMDCAPSLMRDLYHGNQMLRFIGKGWAVVAPDYAGMGTDGRVEFVNATAEANDLADGLGAARQTGLGLSARWVLWGHSQGGGAALALAQRRLLPVTRTGCLGVVTAVYAGLSGSALIRPGYLGDAAFAGYLTRNSTGQAALAGPVLLLQGQADVVIPPAATAQVAAALRRAGVTVDYRTYPGLGHDTIPGVVTGIDDGAMTDILGWIAARFAGKPQIPRDSSANPTGQAGRTRAATG
jgi:pimeloyl-ACP methyl ester carboxylesterase